jgi:hypothetical protein
MLKYFVFPQLEEMKLKFSKKMVQYHFVTISLEHRHRITVANETITPKMLE